MIDVSVVIVTWNSADLIRQCLESIYSWTLDCSLEVLIVDNGSSDETVEIISREFPQVILIEARTNMGFPRASNLGISISRGRFVFLLNPDTRFQSDVASILARFLETHPTAGAVSPRILYEDGSTIISATREFPSLRSTVFVQLGLQRLFPRSGIFASATLPTLDRTAVSVVPCLNGAALMCRSEEFRQFGLLDDQIPMYFEDLDLCARIAASSKLLYYVPAATLIHLCKKSSSKSPIWPLLFAMEKGQAPWLYFRKYRGKWEASIFSGIVMTGSLCRCLMFSLLALFSKLKGHGYKKKFQLAFIESFALLSWSMSPKETFPRRLGSFFAASAQSCAARPLGVANCSDIQQSPE